MTAQEYATKYYGRKVYNTNPYSVGRGLFAHVIGLIGHGMVSVKTEHGMTVNWFADGLKVVDEQPTTVTADALNKSNDAVVIYHQALDAMFRFCCGLSSQSMTAPQQRELRVLLSKYGSLVHAERAPEGKVKL